MLDAVLLAIFGIILGRLTQTLTQRLRLGVVDHLPVDILARDDDAGARSCPAHRLRRLPANFRILFPPPRDAEGAKRAWPDQFRLAPARAIDTNCVRH